MLIMIKNLKLIWEGVLEDSMKIICVLIGIIAFASCSNKHSKSEHIATIQIDSNLYNEVYKVYSGGVFASDSYSNYITDSVNFRKYVGTRYYDDEEIYCNMVDSNTVLVVKLSKVNTNDTIEKEYYKINQLNANGEFD